MNRRSVWGKGEKIARRGKGKGEPPFPQTCSLQCRRVLGGRNLVPVVRVRYILVAAIFDFMTVEDWGNCAVKENACTAGYKHAKSLFTGSANERLWVSLTTQALMAAGDFNTCPFLCQISGSQIFKMPEMERT